MRRFIDSDTDFIVNISNDAWFGQTSAHYQHFAMSVLRAVEFRRPLIRSANTGISAIVSASGTVIKILPPFAEGYILHQPCTYTTQTFYCRRGDLFAGMCFLGWGILLVKRKKYSQKSA
jgi:apolipoprotein N-acyltransferase